MVLSPVYRGVILVLIAGVVLFMSLHPFPRPQIEHVNDELYYYQYARQVLHYGHGAFHDFILWYASSDTARLHPAPVRVGYILLCAFLFKLCRFTSLTVMDLVSTFSFFIFLYVCFKYVRKYFDLDVALLTVLFLASSPLMLGLSRRALIDSPANLLWGLTVWLFLDVLSKPNRFSYVYFLITYITAITFKESSLILIPFFMMAGIIGKRNGAVISTPQIWGIIIYPLTFIFLFYGWLYGGVGLLMTAGLAIAKAHFISSYSSPYAINYCSGPWFRYLLDFLLLTPIETLLFIGYVGYLFIQRTSFDFKRTYFLLYFVYVYAALSSLAHSKVVRFVVNLEMVVALFAVLMLGEVLKGLGDQKRKHLLLYLAIGIFVYNWLSFLDLIYQTDLLDPISMHLLEYRHFIPLVNEY